MRRFRRRSGKLTDTSMLFTREREEFRENSTQIFTNLHVFHPLCSSPGCRAERSASYRIVSRSTQRTRLDTLTPPKPRETSHSVRRSIAAPLHVTKAALPRIARGEKRREACFAIPRARLSPIPASVCLAFVGLGVNSRDVDNDLLYINAIFEDSWCVRKFRVLHGYVFRWLCETLNLIFRRRVAAEVLFSTLPMSLSEFQKTTSNISPRKSSRLAF